MSDSPSKIACLSVDIEPDLHCPEQRIRLFEDEDRLDALCSLLQRNGVPLTSFVVMKYAANYARSLAAIAKTVELELAVHSFSHNQSTPATTDEVRRGWETYCDIWNQKPSGYRSPNCLIDTQGLRNLADQGYLYDSSVTPTVRFDRYGYNNWHLPTEPFEFQSADRSILEFPIACFGGVRLPLVLSYVKMFGLGAIRAASSILPLPNIVVVYFHPYDLYAAEIAQNIPGWKKYAHLRNGRSGLRLLDGVIGMLKKNGYRFMLMEHLAERLSQESRMPVMSSLDSANNH
jgi:peptidoglycan/xylan/chitin deacetylase (PgdA/CDA1 family)